MFERLAWQKFTTFLVCDRDTPIARGYTAYIIQAIVKDVSSTFPASKQPPVIFHIKGTRLNHEWQNGDILPLEFMVLTSEMAHALTWQDSLRRILTDNERGGSFSLAEASPPQPRSLDYLMSEFSSFPSQGEICLEFLTPLPFTPIKGKPRTFISREHFIQSLERRLSRLFGTSLSYQSQSDDFALLPYFWTYTESRYPSRSQPGSTQYLNGCIGKLYLKGRFSDLVPFMILGSELHAGSKIGYSQGYYVLHPESTPCLDLRMPDRKMLRSIVRDIADRYDTIPEMVRDGKLPDFNEEEWTDNIYHQLLETSYEPSPSKAFRIPKKDGSQRLVEHLSPSDLIIQMYLLKNISEVIDKTLEDESIGYRKGTSRTKAIELVRSAVNEGFSYIIESDIEAFFPSVNLVRLIKLLDYCLPEQDVRVRKLLTKCFYMPYELHGEIHTREKGLAQGSPLSPLMANFYLDSFDEQIKSMGIKLIRFADDFIILTRTREEAEVVLTDVQSYLSGLGLGLKEAKTTIKHVTEGFQFLGIQFQGSEAELLPEEIPRTLAKPLYITESFVSLFLDGEAVDIRKQGKTIDVIPFRRISEILVMGKAVFSTAFIRKCVELKIPVTITLNSGYYLTTVKPDSKAYYDILFQHTNRFAGLSEAEHITFAQEFAVGKIKNYASLFRQRYLRGHNLFLQELDETVKAIYQSGDLDQIRGFEGAAAAKVYTRLNIFIDNPSFHIRKRERRNPDPINSMLNLGYYLLFSRVNSLCRTVGLNPYLGFLHSHADNYESLVTDIQELFRARIDRFIIRLLNLKIITQSDFRETERGRYLTSDAYKRFLTEYEKELAKKPLDDKPTLKDSIEVQVLAFRRWAVDGTPPQFYKWKV